MPRFGMEPGIIIDAPLTDTWGPDTEIMCITKTTVNDRRGADRISYDVRLETPSFVRMLAKIAHSYTVAVYGRDAFTPFLIPLILKGGPNAPQFVGSPPRPGRDDRTSEITHQVGIDFVSHHATWLGLVTIRLFAYLGTPRYHVVVGEFPRPPQPSE
jgi:hypothetical protein